MMAVSTLQVCFIVKVIYTGLTSLSFIVLDVIKYMIDLSLGRLVLAVVISARGAIIMAE